MPFNTRATLTPYYQKKRRKWYARGTYPKRREDGTPYRHRGYVGPASDTRAACQEICDQYAADLEAEFTQPQTAALFEVAAETFLGLGGDGRYLTDRLLDEIGQTPCDLIDDNMMTKLAAKLYPACSNATLNRQLYTPVISVLRKASKGQPWKPDLSRPKGYWKLKPAKSPPKPWFDAVLQHTRPEMSALLLCTTMHGVRAGNLLRLTPDAFDPEARTIFIEKDKTGNPVLVKLGDTAYDALTEYNWQAGPGLFGKLTWKNRRGAYRQLETACKRAGVQYYPLHKAGRHAFAKRLLDAGQSLAHVKAAGRWANIKVVAELYGHYAHSEVDDATRAIGEEWARSLPGRSKRNVVPIRRKFGDKTGTGR